MFRGKININPVPFDLLIKREERMISGLHTICFFIHMKYYAFIFVGSITIEKR